MVMGMAGGGRRGGDRVSECVRRVQHTAVLLHGGVCVSDDLQCNAIFQRLQIRMPHRLQLCVRRRHQHFHLRWSQLHHHLLPCRYIPFHSTTFSFTLGFFTLAHPVALPEVFLQSSTGSFGHIAAVGDNLAIWIQYLLLIWPIIRCWATQMPRNP